MRDNMTLESLNTFQVAYDFVLQLVHQSYKIKIISTVGVFSSVQNELFYIW